MASAISFLHDCPKLQHFEPDGRGKKIKSVFYFWFGFFGDERQSKIGGVWLGKKKKKEKEKTEEM